MLNETEMRQTILQWVARPQYSPVKSKLLAEQLGVLKEDLKEFQSLVRRMRREGKLTYGNMHVILPVKRDADGAEDLSGQIVGYFSRGNSGCGFVSQTLMNATPENEEEDDEDIYIPAKDTQDASTGDLVAVVLDAIPRGRNDRGRSGRIERIIERAKTSFVGTYTEKNGVGFVTVDGRLFNDPIRVGDAAAMRVLDGDKVVLEILRYPTSWRGGEGVITEVLGPRGSLKTETEAVMRQFELPERFDDQVLAEANREVELFRAWEEAGSQLPEDREDLTDLYIITIDPADARDFDDAISIEELPNGNLRLGVHIADVSHFVHKDTRLDGEAFDRGNSTYLPDKVIPMLPEVLCNGLASLQPDQARFVKSVFQDFTPSVKCVNTRICNAMIRSNCRLNYDQVDRFFAGDTTELPQEVQDVLTKFRELAKRLRQQRHDRGMLVMNLPEIKLLLDKEGNVTGMQQEPNTESHQMIEEFMVCANEAVAKTLIDADATIMRRIHKAPLLSKLDALGQFLEELGIDFDSASDRFEIQHILEKTQGTKNEFAVHQAVLRAMQRAEYSPEKEGHFALASDYYCHFTSPIRRYADLTIHRQVENLLHGKSPNRPYQKVYDEGKHLSYTERNSESAERELVRVKLLYFLREHGDLEQDAHIVGVTRFGLYVQCDQYPLSGTIDLHDLPEDHYRFDSRGQMLQGFREGNTFRLGDAVRVQVAKLNTDSRELKFRIAGEPEHQKKQRKSVSDQRDDEAITMEKMLEMQKQRRAARKARTELDGGLLGGKGVKKLPPKKGPNRKKGRFH